MKLTSQPLYEYEDFVVLDIGALRIKALLCKVENGDLEVIASHSLRQNRKDIIDGEIADISSVVEQIQKVITHLESKTGRDIKNVVVGVSSNHFLYDVTSVNYVRESEQDPITMQEIDSMLGAVENRSFEKIKLQTSSRLGISNVEMRLITSVIVSISLDGKKVVNPLGFSGKNIKIQVMNIFMPLSELSTYKNMIRQLDKNLVSFIPTPISLSKLTEKTVYYPDANAFLDIGFSHTTLTLQQNGDLMGFFTVPFGWQEVEHMLLSQKRLGAHDVEEALKHVDEHYEEHKEIFDIFFNLLFDAVDLAKEEIAKKFLIRNVFLLGGVKSEIFKKALETGLVKKNGGVPVYCTSANDLYSTKGKQDAILFGVSTALANSGIEILSAKRDPILQILRHIISVYE